MTTVPVKTVMRKTSIRRLQPEGLMWCARKWFNFSTIWLNKAPAIIIKKERQRKTKEEEKKEEKKKTLSVNVKKQKKKRLTFFFLTFT